MTMRPMDPLAYTLVFTFMALCALIAAYRSARDRHWVATTGMLLLVMFLGEATREVWAWDRGKTTKVEHAQDEHGGHSRAP